MSTTVGYVSPYVPPEWIAAYGLQPVRLVPNCATRGLAAGECPFAAAFSEAAGASAARADAVIVTTTCDQMRRTAEQIDIARDRLFMLNMPVTWDAPASRQLYVDELNRLGRFLVRLGGTAPTHQRLVDTLLAYDARRHAFRWARRHLTPRCYAEALAGGDLPPVPSDTPALSQRGVRLAIVGGPLRPIDHGLFDLIEEVGGCVVLNATENGERALPAPFREVRVRLDPIGELADAYFGAIPCVFRRPDSMLDAYLDTQIDTRQVQGIVLVRFLWCDLWHAQVWRLKQRLGKPLVEIDLTTHDRDLARIRTRIESLVNILQ